MAAEQIVAAEHLEANRQRRGDVDIEVVRVCAVLDGVRVGVAMAVGSTVFEDTDVLHLTSGIQAMTCFSGQRDLEVGQVREHRLQRRAPVARAVDLEALDLLPLLLRILGDQLHVVSKLQANTWIQTS